MESLVDQADPGMLSFLHGLDVSLQVIEHVNLLKGKRTTANTTRRPLNASSMLGQRWTNIEPSLGGRIVFVEKGWLICYPFKRKVFVR